MTRNESHMGFLLEPVHSSTPPLVSGTVRSRPLAAKVKPAPTPPLFRRPAMAPMAILRHGLKLWPRGTAERAAREASLRVELLPHHRAAYMPSGPRLLPPPEIGLRRPLSGPSDGANGRAIRTLRSMPCAPARRPVQETHRSCASPQERPEEGPLHARRAEAYSLASGHGSSLPHAPDPACPLRARSGAMIPTRHPPSRRRRPSQRL